jgi:hypothetical protein
METIASMTNVVLITITEFIRLVLSRKGTTIVSFTSFTDPKVKAACPFKGVRKASRVNGIIGYNYENSVNLQREREGAEADFVAEKRSWGTRIVIEGKPTPFVQHVPKGETEVKTYLTVKVERTLESPKYFDQDGNEINHEVIAPYLPPKRNSPGQGLDKEIIHREYALDSLETLTVAGTVYELIHC